MIRLVLVDDQTLVRSGIRGLLSLVGDIEVVDEAADGEQALAVIERSQPDVVLLDIRMPLRSGIDVLKALGKRGHVPPTILLTTFDDDEALLEGMRAGAKGFLLKDISLERLAEAIRCVASGATLFRPAITERVLHGLQDVAPSFPNLDLPDRLTNRETEILRLMAGGFNNREIAAALGTSEGTVKNHVSSILSRLGVRDRVRAVLRGLELEGVMNSGRGRAAPGTGRMPGAATRRSGATARRPRRPPATPQAAGSRNCPPGSGEKWHGVVAPLAQTPSLRVAPRLALHPF